MRLAQDKPGQGLLFQNVPASSMSWCLRPERRTLPGFLHFMKTSSGMSSWQLPEGLLSCLVRSVVEGPNSSCLLVFLYQRNRTFAEGLTGGICLLSPLSKWGNWGTVLIVQQWWEPSTSHFGTRDFGLGHSSSFWDKRTAPFPTSVMDQNVNFCKWW